MYDAHPKLWCFPQGGGGWEERVTGAATLTKDYGRKSYFIQIFDMQYCQNVISASTFLSFILFE